ncbi:hypothetical protein NE237_008396 [Protea cynaroides]|uniref:Uncharacterized protein n=1 Tax=Protea cynaroides TaxID=273540 RepID=A0A9Q0KWL8_9MAGN|nr:hypothetical protein NE237_008396 [Protea cynaroides]
MNEDSLVTEGKVAWTLLLGSILPKDVERIKATEEDEFKSGFFSDMATIDAYSSSLWTKYESLRMAHNKCFEDQEDAAKLVEQKKITDLLTDIEVLKVQNAEIEALKVKVADECKCAEEYKASFMEI